MQNLQLSLALPAAGLLRRSRVLRCVFQPNLTSMTNQRNRDEIVGKFGSTGAARMGVPRISRLETRPINVLHETPHVMVAGRNFCNGFSNNQFLLINRSNKRCVFVDACDDWPDDWAAFVASSGLTPTHIFLTHCHIDNVINLNAFLAIFEQHAGIRLGVMWCPAEQVWVDAFPRACERYQRREEMTTPLPLLQNSPYTYYTYQHQLHKRERLLRQQHKGETGEAAPPQLVRHNDILLSSATNRATSFYEMGPHSLLHYVFTPGHSPGHMMLSLPRERLLFTGDVLYYNKIGRVDLPWATGEKLTESLLTLEDFPDNTVVLPGHGRLTTLGRERRENPALRALYERREIGQQEISVGFNEGYL